MTQWGSDMIGTIARRAGFTGEALHDAVSLAVAASGGCDHYRHNPISAPGAERRGLWAIRVDDAWGDETIDLFNPDVNAEVARTLWQSSSQSFGWHPSWINGTAAQVRPGVVAHLTSGGRRKGPLSGRGFHAQMTGLVALAESMAQGQELGRFPIG